MSLSAVEEIQAGNIRYWAAYHGVVVDADDPDGLHRVRVRIEGLIELSDWAWPITSGGGGPQRGGHVAPKKDADVVVWFVGGDVDFPIYAGGWWGKPDAGSETPTDVKENETAPADAAQVQSLEFERLVFTVDEREGKRAFQIRNKVTGDFVTIDLESHGLHIKMTAAILLECIGQIDLTGAAITLNGRQVLADSKAI